MRRALLQLTLASSLLVCAFPVGSTGAWQGRTTIVVEPDTPVGGDVTAPYVEQMLAMNPVDAANVVGVSMKAEATGMVTVALSSMDGGRTWRESTISQCGFDPWVAFLPDGVVLVSCLARGTPDPVLVLRSEDGGQTWEQVFTLPLDGTSFDHPAIVVDTTRGPRRGTVYLVAAQVTRDASRRAALVAPVLASSTDGGRTFSTPVRLQATNVWANILSPVVFADGGMGFAFVDYALDARAMDRGVVDLTTPRTWWATSVDGGRSLSMPYLVAEIEEMSRWGHAAVDGSAGRFSDRLYVVTDDFRDGAGGVFVHHSVDRGETWSRPARASRPDGARRVRRHPAASVNSDGVLLVAWFDPREVPGRSCWQLLAGASLDGGLTFLDPVPVASQPSCSDQAGNILERPSGPFDVAGRWPAGGDYFGLAAHADGSFRALWSDSRTGVFQLWTARIELR